MSPLTLLPLLLSLLSAAGAWFLPRYVEPRWSARLLSAVAVSAAASTVAALLLIALASLAQFPAFDAWLGWCTEFYGHAAPGWAGAAAAAALVAGVFRSVRWHRRWRAARAPWVSARALEIVPDGVPVAFAVPGRPGSVVIGSTLLDALDVEERDVVLRHELAHLEFRHHRFIWAGEASAAAVPYLIPVANQIRFATERWADEAVAAHVGSRRLVARVIAKAALLGAGEEFLLPAVASTGVVARVEAMLEGDAKPAVGSVGGLASMVIIGVALGGSSVQLHHLAAFFTHVCSQL